MPMLIESVTPEEYDQVFPAGVQHIYNSAAFATLNSGKCGGVRYVLFRDSKVRFGLILGERDGVLHSPFSAPFGGFSYNSAQTVEALDEAVELLRGYSRSQGMAVEIVLPPDFYSPSILPKVNSALLRGGTLLYADINHHCMLDGLEGDAWIDTVMERLGAKARPRLRKALMEPFAIHRLDSCSQADIARAYAVIAANRADKGYPLRMSLDDVVRTVSSGVVDAEFMVMTYDGIDVAAAMVYHSAPGIMQVIYWGDAPGYGDKHVMHRFAPEVMHMCASMGASVLDIGPSSENGIPSFGLCSFKESIGCLPTLKPRYRIE